MDLDIQKIDLIFGKAFGSPLERTQSILRKYQMLYNLPVFEHEENVDYKFFNRCKRGTNFVVAAIYNENKEFLILRDFSRASGWELAGGFINDEQPERPEEAVFRIVKRETGLDVTEAMPIAVIRNHYVCPSTDVTHYGIAFAITARGTIAAGNKQAEFTSIIPENMLASDRNILDVAKDKIKYKKSDLPIEEITSVSKFSWSIWIHKHFIAPILYFFCSRKINNRLMAIIGKPYSFVDIAAGDDKLAIKICRTNDTNICVANDICMQSIKYLTKKTAPDEDIIFTNHNAIDLPFSYVFDTALCKNTLHHMKDRTEMANLLYSLRKISKRIVLCDIEDPKHSKIRAYLWNCYYRLFLGDQGGFFITFNQFKSILSKIFVGDNIEFEIINTIKGNYMVAVISEK